MLVHRGMRRHSLSVDKDEQSVYGGITYLMLMKNDGGLSNYGSSIEGVEIRNRERRRLE